MANPHYAWCRQLGQLKPALIFAISTGAMAAYYQRMAAAGQKLGDVKPPVLTITPGWDGCFIGQFGP